MVADGCWRMTARYAMKAVKARTLKLKRLSLARLPKTRASRSCQRFALILSHSSAAGRKTRKRRRVSVLMVGYPLRHLFQQAYQPDLGLPGQETILRLFGHFENNMRSSGVAQNSVSCLWAVCSYADRLRPTCGLRGGNLSRWGKVGESNRARSASIPRTELLWLFLAGALLPNS